MNKSKENIRWHYTDGAFGKSKSSRRKWAPLLLLLLFCCSPSEQEAKPDLSLIRGYKVQGSQVLYQYYEKFGFTDACSQTRSYFLIKPFKTKGWKKLPISQSDIEKINSFSNKVDTLDGIHLEIKYSFKEFYSDIRIDSKEYLKDSIFQSRISLKEGFYKVATNRFEVYSAAMGTLYLEYYGCP